MSWENDSIHAYVRALMEAGKYDGETIQLTPIGLSGKIVIVSFVRPRGVQIIVSVGDKRAEGYHGSLTTEQIQSELGLSLQDISTLAVWTEQELTRLADEKGVKARWLEIGLAQQLTPQDNFLREIIKLSEGLPRPVPEEIQLYAQKFIGYKLSKVTIADLAMSFVQLVRMMPVEKAVAIYVLTEKYRSRF